MVVGAIGDDDWGSASGAAYIYSYNGSSWIEEKKLIASDGNSGDSFGSSVSITDDRVLIGAPGDDDSGDDSGSAFIFNLWDE